MKKTRNDGRPFQSDIQTVATQYSSKGFLTLKKVDPPARVMGFGANRRVIFLENPFLDFCGVWRERAGRALFVEAKSTSKDRLPIGRDDGVTLKQIEALKVWHDIGAVAFLLWRNETLPSVVPGRYETNVRLITLPTILNLWRKGAKSMDWKDGHGTVLRQGQGFVLFDFRAEMHRLWP